MSKKGISAGSLTLGLLLIIIGILFLVDNFTDITVWSRVWRYWPLILIIFGLFKIFQSITQEKETRAGDIILIIFIIIAGLIITQIAHLEPYFRFDWWQEDYTYESEQEVSCQPDSLIVINNRYGDITVIPWPEEKIKVVMNKRVWARSRGEADRYQKNIVHSIEKKLDRIEITTEINQPRNKWMDFSADLKVMVPKRASLDTYCEDGDVLLSGLVGNQKVESKEGEVQIENIEGNLIANEREGKLSVEGISGSVDIESRYTDITAKNIKSGLTVDNPYGDVFASSIEGGLEIKTKHSKVELSNISGTANIEALYCELSLSTVVGDVFVEANDNKVEIENISGKAEIKAPNCQIFVRNIEKDLIIESSDNRTEVEEAAGKIDLKGKGVEVIVRNASGPVDIRTTDNDVKLYSWRAPIKIENKNGGIELLNCIELNDMVELTTSDNNIIMELPENSSFNIDARSIDGEIRTEFSGGNLQLVEDDVKASLRGSFNQGTHRITIRVENGNIIIRKLKNINQ
jgi:hypothetical protein